MGDTEAWGGVGDGRFERQRTYVYLWLIHVDVWQKPAQCCNANILQLKKKDTARKLEICFWISVPKYNKIGLSQGKIRQWGEYINLYDSLEYTIKSVFFWWWWVLCSQCYFNEHITLLREVLTSSNFLDSLLPYHHEWCLSGVSEETWGFPWTEMTHFTAAYKFMDLFLPRQEVSEVFLYGATE